MSQLLSIITAVHLAALSQIESGDNDAAVGQAGEISRFQMLPKVALKEIQENVDLRGKTYHAGWPLDGRLTERIARGIWEKRVSVFCLVYRRQPTPAELYLCWHRPGRVLNPTKRERELAGRFANLFQKLKN